MGTFAAVSGSRVEDKFNMGELRQESGGWNGKKSLICSILIPIHGFGDRHRQLVVEMIGRSYLLQVSIGKYRSLLLVVYTS